MKEEDELEMLLGEIPRATSSLNQHHLVSNGLNSQINMVDHSYGYSSCVPLEGGQGNFNGFYGDNESVVSKCGFAFSPVSGYSLQSDGSSSSLFSSSGGSHSDIGSQSFPQFEELRPQLNSEDGYWFDIGKANDKNLVDDFNLSRSFSKVCIGDEQEGASISPNGMRYMNQSLNSSAQMSFDNYEKSCNYMKGFSDGRGFGHSVPGDVIRSNRDRDANSMLMGMRHDQGMAKYSPSQSDRLLCPSDFGKYGLSPKLYGPNVLANGNCQVGLGVPNTLGTLDSSIFGGPLFYPVQRRVIEARDSFYSPNMVQMTPPYYDEGNSHNCQTSVLNGRNKVPSHVRMPQRRVESLIREDNLVIPGDGGGCGIKKDAVPKAYNANYPQERGAGKIKEKSLQLDGNLYNAAVQDNCQNPKMSRPFMLPSKCSSLAEARGYIYHIAKNQHGCRILQNLFDQKNPLNVQIIFNEIIDHVAELMMNPFGNYLMQKLLEVCSAEQRMHILLKVTEEPRELVRICQNTHGTRVIQKLIETLRTTQEVSLIVSALEPGFLTLIKDLNANHVVQRCLQCFTTEESKRFIFVGATKHCVEIATHQHGCCVLQRCISYSRGEHREKLVSEISENGFLLAQDAFGNYVIQYILELKVPSATSKITSQFDGKYVNLSTQKFSSHVVERCLTACDDDIKSKIIRELLDSAYFDQLLQDPHANYVMQTALRVSEGRLHSTFVDTIESYRAVARNSPYSKRIFSSKFLKR